MAARQGNVSPPAPASPVHSDTRHSPADKDYTVHRMLIGTHTSDNDNNYVQIATVHLPKPQSELNLEKYDDERGGASPSPPVLSNVN